MKNKLIAFSDQETIWIQEEASQLELSFTEMLRRIVYERYNKPLQPNSTKARNLEPSDYA